MSEPAPLERLPRPGARNLALRVAPAAERAIARGHPWVFESAIRQQSHEGRPGDLAVVFDARRRFLAVGLYDPSSPIRVRVLQHGRPAPIDEGWFVARLAAALALRAPLAADPRTDGYRLVHGENDGLPGLVVDRYAGTLVAKLYTVAWVPHLRAVLSALQRLQPAERVVLRLARAARLPEHLHGLADGQVLQGPALEGPVLFLEHGLRFEADVVRGQKTGFFLDQRENRARVETLAAERDVVNVFAYTGGFSLYAARGGARSVLSLDLSRPALAAAQRNWTHNLADPAVAACRHEVLAEDAFAALARLAVDGRRFDLVVVDPPSFAKAEAEVPRALAAYGRLTRLALGVLAPGGTLVSCSCSSRVSAELFYEAVHAAASQAGRPLRERARSGHPLDHPVGYPEGEYLKCLYALA